MSQVINSKRFLSIQSHVVSGYCGNKSSTFPLQLLGFEVDVINSVQLSNHTQYRVTKGQIYNGHDLQQIHQGLKENNLLRLYDNILSGYVADVGYIESMVQLIRDTKAANAGSVYCLDPVLGDTDCGFYVKDGNSICEAYLQKLIPLADIITPNAFEASKLTGIEFNPNSDEPTNENIVAMIKCLHKLGPKTVALTSFELNATHVNKTGDQLYCILSHYHEHENRYETWMVRIPKIAKCFYGTGDLFAALLSAWLSKTNSNRKLSLENSINTIQAILNDTSNYSNQHEDGTPLSRELRLVQNQPSILFPAINLQAECVPI